MLLFLRSGFVDGILSTSACFATDRCHIKFLDKGYDGCCKTNDKRVKTWHHTLVGKASKVNQVLLKHGKLAHFSCKLNGPEIIGFLPWPLDGSGLEPSDSVVVSDAKMIVQEPSLRGKKAETVRLH